MAVDWSDDALVLGAKRFGETGAIADLLTAAHGRQSGLVRGARGRRMRGTLEPGTLVRARWRARLDTHLGTLEVEPVRSHAGPAMARPRQLAGLVMAMATTFTISVTTAADSIFTLPFTSEPACAEDWDPVLSIIGRGLGLVSVAAAALAGIVFVLMSHASLRAALQEPLTWALGCGSTSGEGEDNMVHPLAHIQLLFGIWGETAEGTFHLPQRFNAYYLHNTSGDVSPKQRLAVGKALARAVGRTFSLAVLCVPWAAPVAIMYANANTEPLFLDGCSFHNSRTRCQRVLEVGAWASSTTLGVLTIVLAIMLPIFDMNQLVQ